MKNSYGDKLDVRIKDAFFEMKFVSNSIPITKHLFPLGTPVNLIEPHSGAYTGYIVAQVQQESQGLRQFVIQLISGERICLYEDRFYL